VPTTSCSFGEHVMKKNKRVAIVIILASLFGLDCLAPVRAGDEDELKFRVGHTINNH
jgi:hypothetical protein